MKQILILLFVIIFLFITFEVLLQLNFYVTLSANKSYNNNATISQVTKKYKLKTVETFVNINKYIRNKSIKLVK